MSDQTSGSRPASEQDALDTTRLTAWREAHVADFSGTLQVIDWAMQAHGGGVCDGFPLAPAYSHARTLRFADGPDEVHRETIAKVELRKYAARSDQH